MTSEKAAAVLRPFGVDVRGVGSPCMASDSGFGRPGIVRGRERACGGGGAGRAACGMRRCLVPSALAAALAVLLPAQWAAAQEAPAVASARETERPAEAGAGQERAPGLSEQDSAPPVASDATELEQITVTGTRIRGGTTPSPVITIGSEAIREEGFADLGEVIRSVPQNFGGGQNPEVGPFNIAGAGPSNSNVTGGSALNLRGLGPDASLTLLNGRRMSYGGHTQAVDIGAIPVEAVERIEIVADGASAIYGSDAVGGVANVILKQDLRGFAAGVRYGAATSGGLATREYTATAGADWATGGLIGAFKKVSADPIHARQRDYTDHLQDPYTIYPGSDLRSGLVSVHQSLGAMAELRLDALRTDREQAYTVHLSPTNRQSTVTSDTSTALLAPSIEFFLPNGWTASVGGSWGKDTHEQLNRGVSLATGLLASQSHDCLCNKSRMYEVGAEGPLFALTAEEARLAVGAGHRTNEFLHYNYLAGTPLIEGEDSSRFAYAEFNVPLVSPAQAGGRRLEVTAAARGEEYDSFGSVVTPRAGLVFGPNRDFTLKASWGRSFKAPMLAQLYRARIGQLSYAGSLVAGYPMDATVLVSGGGNRDLEPERATTWSASLAFHPQAIPGLEAELTWFNVDYTGRVVEPVNLARGIAHPSNAEWVNFAPSLQDQQDFIAAANLFLNRTADPYDPARVVAIIRTELVNATRQRVQGLDASGSYRWDVRGGQLAVRGSASRLDSIQQTSSATPFDLSGTLFNPPKLTARLGAVWTEGRAMASLFANFKGGVRNTIHQEKTGSFTTLDAALRYATDGHAGAWAGFELALTAHNVLNRAPPLHTPITAFAVPPYDATNYSAVGRFVAVSVSKRW
ncbi:TonB-dependent receptor plug domain-containing protein [Luteimonas sp. SDU101]|uniref:TonB-dependent receptor plug domain-containing protein n=1 Tax=Luteimonas sp. SDU101 TaxID=3422593 RepID=UPI003EBF1039